MSGFHDDRTERDYGSGGGYRSNRDVREAARGRGSAPAGGRRDRDPGCRVYVHNLDYGTSWQDLKDHMRGAGGQVEYVKIMQDFDGRSKGFGVCEFTSKQDAQEAIEQLDNSDLQGRQIGLRGDRDAEGDAGRDAARGGDRGGDRPSRRDDEDYRSSRRDDSYRSRRDDDRSQRRERSPRRDRDSYRDRGDDRQRRDDHRSDRAPRQKESRGGKTAEELDAEMDVYKEEKHAATKE